VTTPDNNPGWCPGHRRPPHHVPHRIPTPVGIPACPLCALALLRDHDDQEPTPR
jgi:hypothetical protein